MLLIQDMMLETMAQLRSDPPSVAGWWMIGPTPWALTMHQMKNVMPAMGTTIALRVNKWRLVGICEKTCRRRGEEAVDLHLMDREPDGGEGDEPEQEEAHEVPRVRSRGGGHRVRYMR